MKARSGRGRIVSGLACDASWERLEFVILGKLFAQVLAQGAGADTASPTDPRPQANHSGRSSLASAAR